MHMAAVQKDMNTTKTRIKGRQTSMKERYETPEMEIVEFETEDIITTSGGNDLPQVGVDTP